MVVRANTLTTVLRVTFTDERCDSQALVGATVGSPAFRKRDVNQHIGFRQRSPRSSSSRCNLAIPVRPARKNAR